jgi:hypothetical protein
MLGVQLHALKNSSLQTRLQGMQILDESLAELVCLAKLAFLEQSWNPQSLNAHLSFKEIQIDSSAFASIFEVSGFCESLFVLNSIAHPSQ